MLGYLRMTVLASLLLAGCHDAFEYSPNQEHDSDSPRNLNEKNVRKLESSQKDDTLVVAFAGDSQQFYDELDLFVRKVNDISGVDLVVIAGDISHYGLLEEFEWVNKRLRTLRAPYFGVIGNHDVVANGEEVFKKMFGPLDFSFVYDSVKFILHNTNSREFLTQNVPDLNWMANELRPDAGVKHYVAVSHVPPFSGDFNSALEEEYSSLFHSTPGFLVSLHGHVHTHTDGYPYEDGIRYITSAAFDQRSFILLKIAGGNLSKQIITY